MIRDSLLRHKVAHAASGASPQPRGCAILVMEPLAQVPGGAGWALDRPHHVTGLVAGSDADVNVAGCVYLYGAESF